MAMTKQAHEAALTKIAEIDERDTDAAVELGFYKAAQDLGLNDEQYQAFRQAALELTAPTR